MKKAMKAIMKATKTVKKLTIVSCVALTLCLAVSACGGKDEAEGTKDAVMGIESVALDGESEAGNPESEAVPTEAGTPGGEGGGESAAAAPQINAEILREARTDEGGEEIAFAEYPMFTLAGGGSEGLSAALDTINAQCRSQSETLLDELQESVKEYRESVDPASVFGQGTQAYIYRCDTDVVSIMVMRTVNMGGPIPTITGTITT